MVDPTKTKVSNRLSPNLILAVAETSGSERRLAEVTYSPVPLCAEPGRFISGHLGDRENRNNFMIFWYPRFVLIEWNNPVTNSHAWAR